MRMLSLYNFASIDRCASDRVGHAMLHIPTQERNCGFLLLGHKQGDVGETPELALAFSWN